ncbi:hypothetical protein FA95DRAFT_1607607 [Auriscalpium vulgare]|uniref:Uncharacterized protein n=1 Tax=Auriscalpium vulgare TaxID=40419 RepID=A0ACB8RPN8_9AGAM|nr:hypothetical protein FA95DRAFT_1607607 [Auriscalpium vulgare]
MSLPYDVHVAIIDWVYRGSQHAAIDHRTLSACSLVCKAWTAPAQRLIFRRTWTRHPIVNFVKLDRLLPTLKANPLLGTYVRSICIVIDVDGDSSVAPDYLALLALCPGVTALSALVIGVSRSFDVLLEQLRAMHLPLTYLRMNGGRSIVPQFASLWPGLQCLDVLGRTGPDVPAVGPPMQLTIPRSARLDCSKTENAWVLEDADVSVLRELELASARWDNLNTRALDNLTSLVLDGPLPPQSILDRCTRLEKLVFAEDPVVPVVLPRTLRYVGYHEVSTRDRLTADVDLRYLADALQSLPILSLVSATGESSTLSLALLRTKCKELGVEFVLYDDRRMFRRMSNVDWI